MNFSLLAGASNHFFSSYLSLFINHFTYFYELGFYFFICICSLLSLKSVILVSQFICNKETWPLKIFLGFLMLCIHVDDIECVIVRQFFLPSCYPDIDMLCVL